MKLRKTENAGGVMGKEGCNVFVVETVPDTSHARIVTAKADWAVFRVLDVVVHFGRCAIVVTVQERMYTKKQCKNNVNLLA